MIVFHAGGSPIVETSLYKPNVLLTFLTDVKDGKPNTRMEKLLTLRKKAKKKRRK